MLYVQKPFAIRKKSLEIYPGETGRGQKDHPAGYRGRCRIPGEESAGGILTREDGEQEKKLDVLLSARSSATARGKPDTFV